MSSVFYEIWYKIFHYAFSLYFPSICPISEVMRFILTSDYFRHDCSRHCWCPVPGLHISTSESCCSYNLSSSHPMSQVFRQQSQSLWVQMQLGPTGALGVSKKERRVVTSNSRNLELVVGKSPRLQSFRRKFCVHTAGLIRES